MVSHFFLFLFLFLGSFVLLWFFVSPGLSVFCCFNYDDSYIVMVVR